MRMRHWITALVLLMLVAAAVAGLVLTKETEQPATEASGTQAVKPGSKDKTPRRRERVVDMSPLLTARKMATLAKTPAEQEYARQAVRLANHSVDLAFTDALLRVTETPPEPTPEIKELTSVKDKAEEAVEANQQLIKQLTKRISSAAETEKDSLEDQLEVAKAQLELAQDELDEAQSDLERAGGDPQAKIRRLKAAHDAADKEPTAAVVSPADGSSFRFSAGSLIEKYRAWSEQRNKLDLLAQARQEALDKAERIDERRKKIAERIKTQAEERQAAKQSAAGFAQGGTAADSGASSKETATAALSSLKRIMTNQRTINDMGRRFQDQQELAGVYADWTSVVETHERAALHRMIKGLLLIVATLFAIFIISRLIELLFSRTGAENMRGSTIRTVVKFVVQIVGVLVIIFVLLGVPSQTTTILGLAGAGLTVAMKDFIVAFFGWFVLMGKNGIHVGDWVEIKGVSGEVVDIGLLRTVLLETGSMSDSGHPTGRRVAFVNSFAIEGHFFNFSTSGQWMWDELQVLIPTGQDPFPIINGVQKLVEEKTEANAKLAEQEWQKTTTRYRVKAFSTVPGINVVPTSKGIEMRVRYITRAHESHETRSNLYNAIVELMHAKQAEKTDS
jgi:small-conductance mechanosensitive channel